MLSRFGLLLLRSTSSPLNPGPQAFALIWYSHEPSGFVRRAHGIHSSHAPPLIRELPFSSRQYRGSVLRGVAFMSHAKGFAGARHGLSPRVTKSGASGQPAGHSPIFGMMPSEGTGVGEGNTGEGDEGGSVGDGEGEGFDGTGGGVGLGSAEGEVVGDGETEGTG